MELTTDNRRRLREEVKRRNYNIIWAGGEYPYDKSEVEIIYIDMDNQPAICNAKYYCDIEDNGFYRKKTHKFIRKPDFIEMDNVVAWKEV